MTIQIKKYAPTEHKLKVLVYGDIKTGKTTFAGTAPKPLFICAENGMLSLAKLAPDMYEIKNLNDLKKLCTDLKAEKQDYDTLVIDSLSEISKVIKDSVTNNGQKQMVMRDRGVYADEMMQVVRQIINMPYHVVCIIHSKEITDDSGTLIKYDIAIDGKSKSEVTRYFDTIGYTYIDKDGEYKISIKGSSKTICGDRSNVIDKENTPLDLKEWIKAIGEISVVKDQVIVKEIESDNTSVIDMLQQLSVQYDKINVALDKDNSPANQNILKVNINNAKNLSDEEKANLIAYIDSK